MHYPTYPTQYGQHGDMVMQFVNICPKLSGSAREDCVFFNIKGLSNLELDIGPPLILSLVQIVGSKTCLSVSVSCLIYVGF